MENPKILLLKNFVLAPDGGVKSVRCFAVGAKRAAVSRILQCKRTRAFQEGTKPVHFAAQRHTAHIQPRAQPHRGGGARVGGWCHRAHPAAMACVFGVLSHSAQPSNHGFGCRAGA